jgi:hypothetical protein
MSPEVCTVSDAAVFSVMMKVIGMIMVMIP